MNKCDLEETKHLAVQMFLAAAAKPEEWYEKTDDWPSFQPLHYHRKSKFHFRVYDFDTFRVYVGDKLIHRCREYPRPEREFGTRLSGDIDIEYQLHGSGPGRWINPRYTRHYAPLTVEQKENYKKHCEDVENDECRKAIERILDHMREVEKQKECNALLAELNIRPGAVVEPASPKTDIFSTIGAAVLGFIALLALIAAVWR